jgi:hypothetical protein
MNSGRRRGFTDLIIQSLGAAANAALPMPREAAGSEALRAKLYATSSLQPGTQANPSYVNQPEEGKRT